LRADADLACRDALSGPETRPCFRRGSLGRHRTWRTAATERNRKLILSHHPQATEVRTFHGWLAAGRVVMKGQEGIRLVAPDTIADSGKIASIKPVSVFDLSQMQERTPRAA
jgi:hypothetical protein